jgi:hypothetical protein
MPAARPLPEREQRGERLKKSRCGIEKGRYTHTEAVLAFYAQPIVGRLWKLDETERWWIFRLR